MSKRQYLANAILWAAAIVAAAALGSAPVLATLFLPLLAACALLLTLPRGFPASTAGEHP